jgi:glycosyltransferase involved in cell wall biosynthesis
MPKPVKVLYVCPFAHYSGHHPHVATVEPAYLQRAGVDVTLLTFSGIINDVEVKVPHIQILEGENRLKERLRGIRTKTLPRWILMLVEMTFTLAKAIRVYRKEKYDIIHLRDGEPFIFLSHLLSLPFKRINWFVSLTAAIVFKPVLKRRDIIERPFVCLYSYALNVLVNNYLWKVIYIWGMKRNKHYYAPQNMVATDKYREYLGGVFKDCVECVELGVGNHLELPEKSSARKHLGLPNDRFILLSFGAPNAGKDMETIFKAVSKTGEYLVHGGTHTFSLGSNPEVLAKRYMLNANAKIFNHFIPEEEKPYYFGASDVIILSYTKVFASTSSMMWEAARYGLPCIASNANSLGRDVHRYGLGLLYEAEDAESLAEAIESYKKLSDNERENMKVNCGVFVEEHSDAKWAEKCKNIYRRLMMGKEENIGKNIGKRMR